MSLLIRTTIDLLRYLGAILKPVFVYAVNYCWSWGTPSVASASQHADQFQFADLRAQLMTVPPYAAAYLVTLLVSWSADRYNAFAASSGICHTIEADSPSRALHSAAFSLIGAAGFIGSAVLPATAYSASRNSFSLERNTVLTSSSLAMDVSLLQLVDHSPAFLLSWAGFRPTCNLLQQSAWQSP